jgi:single-stranded DNA-binding protein
MDSWEDKTTGEKRTKIKAVALGVQFLDTRGRREESAAGRDDDATPRAGFDRRAPESRPAPAPAADPRPAKAAPAAPPSPAPAPAPAARRPPSEPDPGEAEDDIPF